VPVIPAGFIAKQHNKGGFMSTVERKTKRERATSKLHNQLSVLSRTALKKDVEIVKAMQELAAKLTPVAA
jgi:hypothetical protein